MGTSRIVEVELGNGTMENITMTGSDIATFRGCRRLLELVLAKDA
jgi:guanosine-diphosphatase